MAKKDKEQKVMTTEKRRKQSPHAYPKKTLMDAKRIIDSIKNYSGSTQMSRIDLARKMQYSPNYSLFRMLISAAARFGLIVGNYSSQTLKMTDLGESIAFKESDEAEVKGLRQAFLNIDVFSNVLNDYNGKKLPRGEVFHNALKRRFRIELADAPEFERILCETAKYVGIVKEYKGGLWVELSADIELLEKGDEETDSTAMEESGEPEQKDKGAVATPPPLTPPTKEPAGKNAFFIGHGKNKKPLKQLKEFLTKYHIPFKVDEDEPYKGRPISKKVKDMFGECGAAILIFTADEEFQDKQGEKIWRPSENVIHELAVASYLYENKIIILKEDKIELPSNVSDLGYIEFSEGDIESKIGGLLQELIGMGIVKLSVAN